MQKIKVTMREIRISQFVIEADDDESAISAVRDIYEAEDYDKAASSDCQVDYIATHSDRPGVTIETDRWIFENGRTIGYQEDTKEYR